MPHRLPAVIPYIPQLLNGVKKMGIVILEIMISTSSPTTIAIKTSKPALERPKPLNPKQTATTMVAKIGENATRKPLRFDLESLL